MSNRLTRALLLGLLVLAGVLLVDPTARTADGVLGGLVGIALGLLVVASIAAVRRGRGDNVR